MGYGDDLLITTYASKIKEKYPDRQIIIGNVNENTAFHSPVYDNNPNISDCRTLVIETRYNDNEFLTNTIKF